MLTLEVTVETESFTGLEVVAWPFTVKAPSAETLTWARPKLVFTGSASHQRINAITPGHGFRLQLEPGAGELGGQRE